MQETISITLPKDIRCALDELTRKEGILPEELIREAVKDYLFFRQLRLFREQMITKASAQGINTDEDVFNRVS